ADWLKGSALQAFVRELVASPSFRQRSRWRAEPLAARLRDPEAALKGFPAWRFIMAALWLEEFGITNA
ncbi:hypothetical protein, partial [Klebsiella pneumoniae]|uniref:hypothetical protein n=1 Tax=Klebsiella pneumoniae TaxID=573 RepID=UPI0039C2FEEB